MFVKLFTLSWGQFLLWDCFSGATVQLVSSLILSSLDYCDSVPSGLPSEEFLCLEKIHNNAARLVYEKSWKDYCHSSLSLLATCQILSRIQACQSCLPSFQQLSSAISFISAQHLITPLILSGLLMRNSQMSQESTQKSSVKGPFGIKHHLSGTPIQHSLWPFQLYFIP